MKTKEAVCKKIILSIFFLLVLCRTAGAQDSQKATLTAADAGTCAATSTACLVINVPSGSGGATFNIGANASANTVQFEATADYGTTWVALSVTPSSSTTTVTSTTSTGAWQANVAGYTKVRMRCSTFVGGTTTTYINLSTASARSGGGGGGSVTHTAGNLTAFHIMIGNGAADATVDSACITNGTGALSGCTSLSAGSGASSAGATATGGFAVVEATSTGWTPTAGQAYLRGSSVLDNFAVSIPLNGATETPLPVFNAVPAGSKCLQSSGGAGLIAEASAACASAPVYPVTVSGTTTSGGVPYFSSTTVESSSALLAANALMVGGGVGAAPATGNGDFTYASHTLTMGAAGIEDLGAGATGSLILPKVSGNAPSTNGTLQFDTSGGGSVTFGTAGNGPFHLAIASGGSGGTNCDPTSSGLGYVYQIGATFSPQCHNSSSFVTSDYTNATTTLSNITGLSFSLNANENYAISCKLIYQGSATTASMVLSSTGPASPTKVTAQALMDTTTGAAGAIYLDATDGTTFGFALGPTAVVTTAADLYSTIDIGIRNGANAGTFQLQAKANGAGTVTIKQGSFCKWQ